MNEHYSPTGERVRDPLKTAYYRSLAVLVVAVLVGALIGAWMAWDYPVDGTTGSYIRGQAPIFIGAVLAGALPLYWALRLRRRWMSARHHDG